VTRDLPRITEVLNRSRAFSLPPPFFFFAFFFSFLFLSTRLAEIYSNRMDRRTDQRRRQSLLELRVLLYGIPFSSFSSPFFFPLFLLFDNVSGMAIMRSADRETKRSERLVARELCLSYPCLFSLFFLLFSFFFFQVFLFFAREYLRVLTGTGNRIYGKQSFDDAVAPTFSSFFPFFVLLLCGW